ncbi:MAG: SDR family NAD(P)-dependent oxidoreductase [Oceanicola sp.]|nr:SDR family NAD(P)-dependent oxidoreductase [Oceanicola sp.]
MRDFTGKRYWLVGASEGLGRALAEGLSRRGAHLVLSARNRDRLEELAAALPGAAEALPMDISDSASVRAAAAEMGPVDGVIFLAGVYWPMKATEWDADKAEAMADINFTGAVRVLGQVVPDMVARDAGHIVITGSLSAFRGLPGAVGYAASKAGTMSLAESLYYDLRKTGVDVQLANPGYIRTRLTDLNTFTMPQIMEPEDAARTMIEHMMSNRFSVSFPAPFAWLFRVGNFLPNWLYYRLFA